MLSRNILFLSFFITISFFSCSRYSPDNETPEIVKSTDEIKVFVFLSPTCPLCQNYTLNLNQLSEKYRTDNVKITGVFSPDYVDAAQLEKFRAEYKIDFECVIDPMNKYKAIYKPEVTPEVFLCDSTGVIVYSGAIDNWMYDTGKKRAVVTEHYLEDAIKSLLEGKEVKIKSTTAYGCFVE